MDKGQSAVTETVLVVEDGDAVRNLVCQMLVQNGYRVLEARDGWDALRMCETHPGSIDLVLTDLVMPNMSGGELAYRLAQRRPDLRILFMSGYADEPVVQRLGSQSPIILEKPFTSVALADKIRKVLDSPWTGVPLGRKAGG